MQAFYDHEPSKFEAVGNGSYIYRWNIRQQEAPEGNGNSEESENESSNPTQWTCDELVIWSPVSARELVRSVIGEVWDSDHEQKLVNEYNGAQLGLYDSETAERKVAAYTAFLTERNTLKAQVEADCAELGIL